MTAAEIREKLNSSEYDFIRTNEHLGKNIAFITVGGSHAYGTSVPDSDLDIRGCALNTKAEILTNQNFEQFHSEATDTTIYSFNKLINLLINVNPNTIEMLGNKPEYYFYLSHMGRELLEHKHMFLSRKAIHSFGGYANQQLRRLENKSARLVSQSENERHILDTIKYAREAIVPNYCHFEDDDFKLYIDKAVTEGYDTEIFADVHLTHYPLRDYKGLWSELNAIVKSYNRIGKRNEQAIEHNKLGKHMMHLIRLYLMCIDILEKEEIVTYRPEHDLLMSIRNGEYLDDNRQPIPEFYEMVDELEKRMNYAKENTSLPDKPNMKEINEFVMYVNEKIVRGIL